MENFVEDLVTITVDGRQIRAPKGSLLWEVCRSHGIDVPIFCYHTKLGPVGACRTCLVELQGAKGPITACTTPVAEGMVVRTRSPIAEKAQRGIFEFLLANHPLDCPICDRGGECPLQDQTFAFGPGTSRYVEPKRHHVKPIALGPTIALDRERCVLCWRCVRFCADVAEDKSIILLDRGDHTVVGTYQDQPYVSNFSGNVIELCPVGALTSRKQRFNYRPWELQNRPSVCPHCPMGCNINVSVRKNDEVIRFLSRDNPEVDDSWLCDRGRFGFEFINSPQRLGSPLLREGNAFVESSWEDALGFIHRRIATILEEDGPDSIAGLAGPRLSNEDLFTFRRFMTDVIGSAWYDHYPRPALLASPEQRDRFRSLDRTLASISDLDRARTILLLGADPSTRAPVLELRIRKAVNQHGARLVVLSDGDVALNAKAAAAVPIATVGLAQAVRALAGNRDMAEKYFTEGPVVVIYDDSRWSAGELEEVTGLIEGVRGRCEVCTLPLLDACNSMGARDLGLHIDSKTGLAERIGAGRSPFRALLLLGTDPSEPGRRWTRPPGLELLVVQELFMTPAAAQADVVLPAASFAEKSGTFTNLERRIQSLVPAVPPPGIARPDWEILVDLSQYFEHRLDYTSAERVWDDIARSVPAYGNVAFQDLGPWGVRPGALQPV